MKKNHRLTRILFITLFSILTSQFSFAQYNFLQGIAIFVGETSSRDQYINLNPISIQSDPNFLHAKPPSHRSTEFESASVGIFAEMLKSANWRWVTEIDFVHKGANELDELVNPVTNQHASATNVYTNIQWNNYLKRWVDLGFRFKTYIMFGARIEYTMASATPAYGYVAGLARKINVTPDLGVGAEFHLKGPWNLFVEEHYNPDVIPVYTTGKISLWNRTWETRLGIIYRFKSGIGSVDMDCNAPRYHGR
jgi:hypothetical protein